MLGIPAWATWLISLVARLVSDWQTRASEAKLQRDAGAAAQRDNSRLVAEAQEARARAAAQAAQDQPDDPSDLRD